MFEALVLVNVKTEKGSFHAILQTQFVAGSDLSGPDEQHRRQHHHDKDGAVKNPERNRPRNTQHSSHFCLEGSRVHRKIEQLGQANMVVQLPEQAPLA